MSSDGLRIGTRTVRALERLGLLRRARVALRADSEVYEDLLRLRMAVLTDESVSELAFDGRPLTASGVMTTREAAEQVGISPHGIRDAIRGGRLEAEQHAGRWLIPSSALAAFVARREGR